MTDMNIPIDADTVVEREATVKLGPQVMEFPEGEALCDDACSSTVTVIENPETGHRCVMLSIVAEHYGARLGSNLVLNSAQARSFAQGLLAGAEQVEAHNRARAN